MRHDPILRWTACVVLAASAAGCGSTGGGSRGAKEEISQNGQANVHLAQSYMQAGKYELALDRVDRALRSDPGSADAHVVKGLILERLDQRASAGEHYVRAAKLAPEKGSALNAAGVFLCENRNYAEAEAMLSKATQDLMYDQRASVFYNAGKCATDAGDLVRAEAHMRGGLAVYADDPRLLEQMVRVKVRQGDLMGARAFLQRREAIGAPGPEILALAVRIEQGPGGDPAAARRYQQQLQSLHPGYTPPPAGGSQP